MKTERLFDQAHQARLSSKFKKAQKLYQTLLKNLSNPLEKAEAALGLADVERIQGDFRSSLRHYESASKWLKGRDPLGVMDAQVGWALAARAIGRPTEALKKLKLALPFYKKEKDAQGDAFVHWALGGTYRIAGDMIKGLAELQTAFRLYQKLKDDEGLSYTCCALGGVYRMLGHYAESGRWYREANRRMRKRKDTFGTAYSYCGLGNVERMAGRFHQALPFYRKAEKLYGTIGDRVSYAYTLWSIGTAEKMLSHYPAALKSFKTADKLFIQTGDTRGRIYTLLGFAEVEFLNNQFKKGFRIYWKKAEILSNKYSFSWEKLHVNALLKTHLLNRFEKIKPAWNIKERKEVETKFKNALLFLQTPYQKTGSLFYPVSLPINWP
jgi:tetratricopeptide (TPR) repeat protein